MTQAEFIKMVNDEISVSCALPVNIPEKEIIRLIDTSWRWFIEHYEDSVEEGYLAISHNSFNSAEYLNNKYFTLDSSVRAVVDAQEVGKGSLSKFYNDPDFSIDKFIMRDVQPGLIGQNLFYYSTSQMFIDTVRSLFLQTIKIDFNKNTKRLKFLGKLPTNDVVVTLYSAIPVEFFYEDDYFFRYVVARAKVQLSRILGTFTFNLIGNGQINFDLIREEGTTELENIKEEIGNLSTPDWFIVVN